jgi:FKBP-type peptidyl-prolyl cis-trans isomerase (trigger factor)
LCAFHNNTQHNTTGGEDVEIVMDEEKFMPGLMEGLLGVGRGETREVRVTFPAQLGMLTVYKTVYCFISVL